MSLKKLLPYILIILILTVAAVVVLRNRNNTTYKSNMSYTTNDLSSTTKSSSTPSTLQNNSFTDPDFGFVFKYPSDVSIGRFEEGDGINIVLNKASGSVAQIYITPFDEAGVITSARIKKDLPDKVIEQPGDTKIGGNQTFVFYSKADDGSKVREYWFVSSGNLYRVTTPVNQDELTQKILATWENE